ncbi:hypothetical protein CHS0354_013066 [Potamilus streckersoni]|uniref:Uncharacterized protein n=1 Tax=Potamilus streckersoni TaxID=2493646 RepID=A0AAE0W6H3_9BIVA|nr:hypothetical protein CHS0354_013066 [Potamilus streckersoni]
MTEVSSSGTFVPSVSRMGTSYFPNIPPRAPKTALSYPRYVLEAPYSALMGVVVDGRVPERHPVTLRCRERNQVGHTNRWRLPESLGSDLLGSSQAIRSISTPYNETMVHIMTAESPQLSLNLDTSKPYQFRQIEDRPYTLPMSGKWRSVSAVHSGHSVSRLPATAPPSMPRRKQIDSIKPFTPTTARPATPKDIFLYHSKRSTTLVGPDGKIPPNAFVGSSAPHEPFHASHMFCSDALIWTGSSIDHFYKNRKY